jgi:hypothetical protein
MIVTKGGRLGLASKDVKEGDKICILYGCSVPVLLRMNSKKTEEEYDAELDWELKFIYKTLGSCCNRYTKRKRENRKHRDNKWQNTSCHATKKRGVPSP